PKRIQGCLTSSVETHKMTSAMKLGVRSSGVLLHPTSLPGPFGIGDIGPEAHRFARALAACGQSWWQMLPIVNIGIGHSPYSAVSSFAGNPLLLSLDLLAEQELLSSSDLAAPSFPEDRVDFQAAERFKRERLLKAFHAFEASPRSRAREDLAGFREANRPWL